MSFQVAGHQTEAYRIETEVYEGPLDLLLDLIERSELDITRLALAQVTDQYLAYMHALQERNAAEISAFLVIAARLVQIKSAALLPRPSLEHKEYEEEDPGEALARQLLLYKRFKEIATMLEKREADGLSTYLRLSTPPKIEPRLDLSGVTLSDLMLLAREIFSSSENLPSLSEVIAAPRITIREKIHWILDNLRQFSGILTFQNLLKEEPNRLEIVVTFLALLELIKRNILDVRQTSLFSEIFLSPLENWDDKVEGELEFE